MKNKQKLFLYQKKYLINKINIEELIKKYYELNIIENKKNKKQESDKILKYSNSNNFKNFLRQNGKVWKSSNFKKTSTNKEEYYSISIIKLKELLLNTKTF